MFFHTFLVEHVYVPEVFDTGDVDAAVAKIVTTLQQR